MTVQSQIDTHIAALLSTIFPANGYNTSAGQNVYKNLEYTEHPETMPCIAWFPGDLQSGVDVGPTPPDMGEINHIYAMSWEGFIEDDLDGTQGRLLKADLARALFMDPHFGGLIEIIEGCTSSVAVQSGDSIFSIVQVSFSIFYTTPFGEE